MMLSWKMAACLAAGNTVVIKPANVCPLTALKFAGIILEAVLRKKKFLPKLKLIFEAF